MRFIFAFFARFVFGWQTMAQGITANVLRRVKRIVVGATTGTVFTIDVDKRQSTPLQNSLVELYGLSTLIDDHLFGDINAFRARYAGAGSSITDLRQRLATFCKRTLRNQVTEYVRYTERRAITRPFTPSDAEH